MLTIVVPGDEFFDNDKEEFLTQGDTVLHLEHSLVSLSKWETIFEKPFLGKEEKTTEEMVAYVHCMNVGDEIPPAVFSRITKENVSDINAYINAKKSATWFSELPTAPRASEIITSELIYYWLVTFNIPFEVETWHLNRLFNLIKICNIKSAKPKKMSRSELAARNKKLNEQRKAQYNTRG
jgi:hypothetical protein